MARQRSPLRDKAEELYLNSKGTMKLVDIAAQLNLKDTQIRKWKSQDKWDDKLNGKSKGTLPNKKVQSKSNVTNKKVTKKQNKSNYEEPIADEVKEVMENEELTDKQKLFCIFYSKCFNATKAYQKAYICTYNVANAEGYKLLVNPCIKKQIDELTKIRFNKEALKAGVLQKYIDIAFADLGDYMKFGKKQKPVWERKENGDYVEVIDPNTGEQKIQEYSYVELKESSSVDTSLLTEVSEGKDGIKIKLADKMKALDFLNKHLNLLSDEDKIKLDIANKKLQGEKLQADIEKTRAEINKMTGNDLEIEDTQEAEDDIYGSDN